jgi:pyruvate dehydrogenase E1 component
LNGEGLQHQDGHSLLIALTNPAVVAWDPFCSYELSYIVEHGINRMWGQDKDEIHYITVYNENHAMPAVPENPDFKEGLLKGLYKFREAPAGRSHVVRLVGSGSIMQQVFAAESLLEEYGVGCEIWSATNFGELHRDAVACERLGRLNPLEPEPRSWVQQCLGDFDGVTVCATDNQVAYPQLVRPYVGGDYTVLGTDGFGRSDTRDKLRRFFEVDGESIAAAVLSSLSRQGKVEKQLAADAISKWGLETGDRLDITVA